jgi:hypothetical protein
VSIAAAQRVFGIGLHNTGHHSHSHHSPGSYSPPPRYGAGGWSPPGTGPFRPGPGSPSFGARMPETHRPGVTFGPGNHGRYGLGRPTGWEGRLTDLFHGPNSSLPQIGSHQRWHAVTHMGGHRVVIGGQVLTPAQITELKGMMVAALQSGAIKSASQAVPLTPAQAATLASWANRKAQGLQSPALAQTSNAFRAAHTLAAANQQKYSQLALADSLAASLTKQAQDLFTHSIPGSPTATITNATALQPPPGSGLDSNLDAQFNANVNVPDPSASVSLKL